MLIKIIAIISKYLLIIIEGSNHINQKQKILLFFIIFSLIALLLLLLIFLLNKNINDKNNEFNATTLKSTTTLENSNILFDSISNVSITVYDERYFNKKLIVNRVENNNIENAIMVYDFSIIDENNNILKLENSDLLSKIFLIL